MMCMYAKATPANNIDYIHLPYKSHRSYLTNHMESISHHITPLAINSLRADTHTHTHKCKHTRMHRHLHRNNIKKPGVRPAHAWFNNPSEDCLANLLFQAFSRKVWRMNRSAKI